MRNGLAFHKLNCFDIDLARILFIPKVRKALQLRKTHGLIERIGFVIGGSGAHADGFDL